MQFEHHMTKKDGFMDVLRKWWKQLMGRNWSSVISLRVWILNSEPAFKLNFIFWCPVVCSWVYARKWAPYLQGPQLSIISGIFSAAAWAMVLSPVAVLITWGVRLIILLDHDTVGLAVIMAGTAALLAFYAIMLWWRTQWQSSRMHSATISYMLWTS